MFSTRPGAISRPTSASRITLAISAGRYNVLRGTAIAPIRDTASHQVTQSVPLAKNNPTRAPLPMPCASSQRARSPECRCASAYVSRSVGVTR